MPVAIERLTVMVNKIINDNLTIITTYLVLTPVNDFVILSGGDHDEKTGPSVPWHTAYVHYHQEAHRQLKPSDSLFHTIINVESFSTSFRVAQDVPVC